MNLSVKKAVELGNKIGRNEIIFVTENGEGVKVAPKGNGKWNISDFISHLQIAKPGIDTKNLWCAWQPMGYWLVYDGKNFEDKAFMGLEVFYDLQKEWLSSNKKLFVNFGLEKR